jgi:NAD-dependent oxidoreductase involved in siderophore biosynthesis
MCVPNPLSQWVSTFCNVPMAMNVQEHLDAMCDTYVSITQEVSLQVGCEHLLVLPTPTLDFSRQRIGHCFLKR